MPLRPCPVTRALGNCRAGYWYGHGQMSDGGANLDTPLEVLALKKQMEASDSTGYRMGQRSAQLRSEGTASCSHRSGIGIGYLLLSSPYAGQKGPNPLRKR